MNKLWLLLRLIFLDFAAPKGYDAFLQGGIMKKAILFAVVLFVAALMLPADVYIKTNVHTDAFEMMGQKQPAKDETTEQWLNDKQLAVRQGERVTILDLGKNIMYIVNLKEKNYVEAALPLDMAKLLPPEAASMASMMKMSVKIAANGQAKKIGQWNCAGYDVDMSMMMMKMKMVIWASAEVPFDWKAFAKMYANVAKMQFMDDASIAEFNKIKGFQVATETSMDMMGSKMKVTSTVTEISQKPAPAGTYAVPAGFAKEKTLSMKDMQGR